MCLASSADAGAVVGAVVEIIVGAIVGALVGSDVALILTTIAHKPWRRATQPKKRILSLDQHLCTRHMHEN